MLQLAKEEDKKGRKSDNCLDVRRTKTSFPVGIKTHVKGEIKKFDVVVTCVLFQWAQKFLINGLRNNFKISPQFF